MRRYASPSLLARGDDAIGASVAVHRLNHVNHPMGGELAAKSPENPGSGTGVCEPPKATGSVHLIRHASLDALLGHNP